MNGVRVVNLRETIRDLQQLGVEVEDIKAVFSEIASEGAQLASSFAPRRTGRLAASIRGNKSKNKAVITAGRGSVPYAGVINYGWPKRGIAASHFMQKADQAIAPKAATTLDKELTRLIREKGF